KPFEVAIVAGSDNAWTRWTNGAGKFIPANEIDQFPKVLRGQARTPEQINHRAGKLLIGFPRDSGAFRSRKPIPESGLQIAQRHPPSRPVEASGQGTGDSSKLHGERTWQARDDERKHAHPKQFQLVADRFPR